MSKLAALMGKPQIFKIGELELELKPLSIDELELFNIEDNMPVNEQIKLSKKLIARVLKQSIPDATDDEINGISLAHLKELMQAINKLHNMDSSTQKINIIKNAIQQRQAAKTNQSG